MISAFLPDYDSQMCFKSLVTGTSMVHDDVMNKEREYQQRNSSSQECSKLDACVESFANASSHRLMTASNTVNTRQHLRSSFGPSCEEHVGSVLRDVENLSADVISETVLVRVTWEPDSRFT